MADDAVRVLIVDDEADVRMLLRVQLDLEDGITVVGEAGNGEEAIAACAEEQPDAVLMDLLMPEMSGFEAIGALRQAHPQVGIVAYTAVAGDFVRQEMQRLGVELVLKTGDVGPIAAALRRAAGSRSA